MSITEILLIISDVILVLFILDILVKRLDRKQRERKSPYNANGSMKIIYNPITEKWMWTKLNLNNFHTWEWLFEATPTEVEALSERIFTEPEAMKIISYRDKTFILEDNHNG